MTIIALIFVGVSGLLGGFILGLLAGPSRLPKSPVVTSPSGLKVSLDEVQGIPSIEELMLMDELDEDNEPIAGL